MVEPRLLFVIFLAQLASLPLSTSGLLGESWRQCGRLVLSRDYVLLATKTENSAEIVEVADTSVMNVRASVSNGELFCMCKEAPEGMSLPTWTKVTVQLASGSNETGEGVRLFEVHLPISAACAGLGAYQLTCSQPLPGIPVSKPLRVPSTTAVKLVPIGGGVVPGSMKCERNVDDGVVSLDRSWTGIEEQGREDDDRETSVVVVDLEKLREWSSCHMHNFATLQLFTDQVASMEKAFLFLQVFSVDVDSCVKSLDSANSAISKLPLMVSFQPTIQTPTKLPPKDIHARSANDIHAESRVYDTLIRKARIADSGSSSPPTTTTVHASVAENSPPGTVVATVQAGEGSGDVVRYSMVSISSMLFGINESTGVILTKGSVGKRTLSHTLSLLHFSKS